ncbi:hypothetical protein P154DRAFT_598201 [Amniculicola lignicola CBS 123094]|uniref:Uncharacterized protein n=1 Tax=Amniculicola lignicola CBS 123094 TaxID=1392246 RepID=A0A6A5WG76_9PLEO|nr:hypothetical protein P154DRAFT_598201 [Amniculicola lignicola CBS 123094]
MVSYPNTARIPTIAYILALTGSLCFVPLALILRAALWMYDHSPAYWRANAVRIMMFTTHFFLLLLGVFLSVGETYGVILQILDAYTNATIGSVFTCADNINSSKTTDHFLYS